MNVHWLVYFLPCQRRYHEQIAGLVEVPDARGGLGSPISVGELRTNSGPTPQHKTFTVAASLDTVAARVATICRSSEIHPAASRDASLKTEREGTTLTPPMFRSPHRPSWLGCSPGVAATTASSEAQSRPYPRPIASSYAAVGSGNVGDKSNRPPGYVAKR